MKTLQSSGDGKTKSKHTRRSRDISIEIKQETDVKKDSSDNVEMVDIPWARQLSSSTEASGAINSRLETNREVYFEYDANYLKKEIKSECECSKEECESRDGEY